MGSRRISRTTSMMELDVNRLRDVYPGTKGWSGTVFRKVSSCLLNETTSQFVMFRIDCGITLKSFGPFIQKLSSRSEIIRLEAVDFRLTGGLFISRPLRPEFIKSCRTSSSEKPPPRIGSASYKDCRSHHTNKQQTQLR